jgi:hypothetical protein
MSEAGERAPVQDGASALGAARSARAVVVTAWV